MNCKLCHKEIAGYQSDELLCSICYIEYPIPPDICWVCSAEKHKKEEHDSVDLS